MGILSVAIDRFNDALSRLEKGIEPFATQADEAMPLMVELSQLKDCREKLTHEVEILQAQAEKDHNRRDDTGKRLDKTIGELKRILG